MGIKKVINPVMVPIPINKVCLIKKYEEEFPNFFAVSARAIDDEYTITRPIPIKIIDTQNKP
jgi:hypothetical protein